MNLTGSAPREWARNLLYVCLSACIAIAFVECIKFIFGRCRPGLLFSEGRYGFTWLTQTYELHSFPSGHSTRIFALATAAAIVYRRFAVPCLALAALVGISRVLALKHYPSDVLTGAYLGIIVAFGVFAVRKAENK